MALYNSYGNFNLLKNTLPDVTYESVPTYYVDTTGVSRPIYWRMTRHSVDTLSYLGMSQVAAEECKKDLQKKWTKKYMDWDAYVDETDPDAPVVSIVPREYLMCSASIQPKRVAGDDWCVEVQIEETDVVISKTEIENVEDIEEYFQQCSSRVVNEDSLRIVRAERDNTGTPSIYIFYTHEIEGFDRTKLKIYGLYNGIWNAQRLTGYGNGFVYCSTGLFTEVKLIYDNRIVSNSRKFPNLSHVINLTNVTVDFDFDDETRPNVGDVESGEATVRIVTNTNPSRFKPMSPNNWSIDFNLGNSRCWTVMEVVRSISADGTYDLIHKSKPYGGRTPLRRDDLYVASWVRPVYNDGSINCNSGNWSVLDEARHRRFIIREADFAGYVTKNDARYARWQMTVWLGVDWTEYENALLPRMFFDFDAALNTNDLTATFIRNPGTGIYEYTFTFDILKTAIPEGTTEANICVRFHPIMTGGSEVWWWTSLFHTDIEADDE